CYILFCMGLLFCLAKHQDSGLIFEIPSNQSCGFKYFQNKNWNSIVSIECYETMHRCINTYSLGVQPSNSI
ncbi:hypothetical protein DERP_000295, partial [Dermatophagoides pteronyssinus]